MLLCWALVVKKRFVCVLILIGSFFIPVFSSKVLDSLSLELKIIVLK